MRFVIALAMGDGDIDRLMEGVSAGESGVVALNPQMLTLANEAQIAVTHEDARQKPALAQYLESIAYAEHKTATRGMRAARRP